MATAVCVAAFANQTGLSPVELCQYSDMKGSFIDAE
jgi:hypothetical protein